MSEEEGKRFNKLPPLEIDKVRARAQAILDLRGLPPYKERRGYEGADERAPYEKMLSEEEAAVLSEFVFAWLPQLTQREKEPK